MARLRDRFITRTRADRENLTAAYAAGDLPELRRLAHSLSGSGGIFGFASISEAAANLERGIDCGKGDGQLESLLAALLTAIDSIE